MKPLVQSQFKALVKCVPVVLIITALWGCSSSTPVTRYYLLSSPNQPAAEESSCGVKVGSVTVAPYLQRTHIVLQSGANKLAPAVQHRWSEPLEAGVRRLLSRCLGSGVPSERKANVRIEHLHGNTNGTVVIQANWALSAQPPMATVEEQFSTSKPQLEAGYDALVSTQRQLVLQLCADIKSAVPEC